MSSDINRVIIIGRMTRDSELKYTPSGTAVASFSLANNRSYSQGGEKKDQVSYFDCVAWSKLGEIITEYVKKGKMIAVEGKLQQRRWKDQDGNSKSKVEIVVENFQFLSPGQKEDGGEGEGNSPAPAAEEEKGLGTDMGNQSHMYDEANPFDDSDIPF